ncbi:FecR domain-containing protein [Flavitalea sp. BT771]|uniref:FecR family protein n=1 Tax=Flavitalea sp. BT771 TaxID=3063329 RepID=UPI0026E2E1BC|nr:FecR domain-containing protein [Flavitalea sp. BT771]MDO6429356.1 FecR domain-containing protein [Flavitalea sp. BT771]MDV6218516.1 FecR domain-containing protein [Flavitalea sp. BT771]
MDQQRLNYLLQQYMAESATAEELEELSTMVRSDAHSDLFKSLLAEMMHKEAPAFPADRERWQQMQQDIMQADRHSVQPQHAAPARVVKLYRWSAAAAVLFLIGLGGYFWADQRHSRLLSAAETTIRDSVISTARGEQRGVILPDGSQVWLNSASSIRFPVSFASSERAVELSGEGFFDVKNAGRLPFVIHSGAITTTVLGTAFDITAYPQQKTMMVAVQSGKVKVEAGSRLLAVLEKGRQVKVISDTVSLLRNLDTLSIAAWRTGNLIYKDECVEDIAADLQRAFKDSISIKNSSLKQTMITLSFNKRDGLQHALEMISRTTDSRLSRKNGIFTIE